MPQNVNILRKKSKYILFFNVKYVKMNQKFIKKSIKMTNLTTLKKYFFIFIFIYLFWVTIIFYVSKIHYIMWKKHWTLKKNQFSLYFWGLFLSKFWTQTLKNGYYLETFFSCKINLTYIGNFLGCVLFDIPKKACWRPALMVRCKRRREMRKCIILKKNVQCIFVVN